jgi:hypothetical protein
MLNSMGILNITDTFDFGIILECHMSGIFSLEEVNSYLLPVTCLEHPLSNNHMSFFFYKENSQQFGFSTHNLMGPFWLENVLFDT